MSIEYDKLNMFCECRRSFSVSHGEYSTGGTSGEVNGDAVCSFKGERGDFYMLICDGMGSGREASLTARVSALFLRRMISAGCPEKNAIEMLNGFTKERRIECFSTVDLLRIDPFGGKATFFKSGAAPSFVLRASRLFKIECDTAPVGILEKVVAKTVDFDLKEGDRIVMVSDGILPGDEEGANFYGFLTERKNFSGKLSEDAKKIALAGRKNDERRDDSTVGIVKIDLAA